MGYAGLECTRHCGTSALVEIERPYTDVRLDVCFWLSDTDGDETDSIRSFTLAKQAAA